MTRPFRTLTFALVSGLFLLVRPLSAAELPTYVIAFVPVHWAGSLDAFDAEAQRQGEFFVEKSGIGEFANLELEFVHDRLDIVSLSDRWLVEQVVVFGLLHQPADRYIGLTNGDLALDGSSRVVGWTGGPDSQGMVVEAGNVMVSAHELGHTFELCDEYYYPYWERQDSDWGCPNPFPAGCPQADDRYCGGQPAPDGSNSIMGPAGLAGPYAYNTSSLVHLRSVFLEMFGPAAPLPESTPAPPTPEPAPTHQSIVIAEPSLVRIEPKGGPQQLALDPALHPDWSPDGEWIAFASPTGGNLDLYRVPAKGGDPQRLTESPSRESHPRWLPDGTHLVLVSDGVGQPALHLLDVNDRSILLLVGLPQPASWPAVSIDGSTMAFSAAPSGDWELYQVDLDPDWRPIPDTLARLTSSPGPDISPAWSPDSLSLAFASARSGSLDLHRLRLADSSVIPLTTGPASEWAPNWLGNEQLLYHAYDGDQLGVWVLQIASGRTTPLATGTKIAAWPVAQP